VRISGVIRLPLVLLDPDLPVPSYANLGDAGLDLRSRIDAVLEPGKRMLIPVGILVQIPTGYGGFVLPRSGLAIKHGVTVLNGPGLIDAGYRGEVMVPLINTDPSEPYLVTRGDRIAQLVVMPVPEVVVVEVDALDDADRGGGFGSSGR
jgi:dUTP pyrophosphatase